MFGFRCRTPTLPHGALAGSACTPGAMQAGMTDGQQSAAEAPVVGARARPFSWCLSHHAAGCVREVRDVVFEPSHVINGIPRRINGHRILSARFSSRVLGYGSKKSCVCWDVPGSRAHCGPPTGNVYMVLGQRDNDNNLTGLFTVRIRWRDEVPGEESSKTVS